MPLALNLAFQELQMVSLARRDFRHDPVWT